MPPPRRSYATPEETFGITRKPLNDWLDFAASGLPRQGPAFSTELEDANIRNQQRELQSMQLQRDLASEQAASDFLSQAAGKNPQGLMRMLAESPEILGSRDAPMIQDYVSQRRAMQEERMAKQPLSNKTLGPALARSLTDPMERMEFEQRLAAGEEAADAYQSIQESRKTAAQQAARQKEIYDALAEGAIDEAEVDAILNSENPERAIAAAKGRAKRAGKAGGESQLERARSLMAIIKDAEDIGDIETADMFRKELRAINLAAQKPASPSTGAVIPQEAFAAAAAAAPVAAATPAVPDLPPAPPATEAEEKQIAEQQQRGAREAEKQRLADVTWTGLKGAAAARGAPAEGPADIVAEARKAIVGGQTTSKRAQRIAALARAYADERQVSVGERLSTKPYAAGTGAKEQILASPAEALVRELGFEPDAIVGQAPSYPGGPVRNITALEASEAILADAADPFIKLREGRATQEKAAQISDKVAKGLDTIEGKGNTLK